MNVVNKYVIHIDNLRRRNKLKVADFCDGICSERQYRRYLSGEQSPMQDKITLFCNKLRLSVEEFYASFHMEDKQEYEYLLHAYMKLSKGELDEALKRITPLNNKQLLDLRNTQLYTYILITIDFEGNKITKYNAYDRYSALINYPNHEYDDYYNFIDIITLRKLVLIEYDINKTKALELLTKILLSNNKNYISGSSTGALPTVYQTVAKVYGMLNQLDVCLEISLQGIKEALRYNNFLALPHLYYYVSLCYYKTHQHEKAKKYAELCIATCIAKQNESELLDFSRLILKDQSLNISFDTTYKKNTL